MNIRRTLIVCAAVMVAALPSYAAVKPKMDKYILFGGSNISGNAADSSEQASHWIPVRGATRIVIRTWTNHAAFSATNTDKAFTDSITTFKVLLSDSVSFIARDSAGTIVTASNRIPTTSSHGEPYPICADSIMVDPTTASAANDSLAGFRVGVLPINRQLRAPAVASGLVTIILPTSPGIALTDASKGTIYKDYLRIRVTPKRRLTSDTSEATSPTSTSGLKGFTMWAYVYYGDPQ